MSSPCEFSAQCTTFEISLNASCHFTTPAGDGDHRALVSGVVNYTLASVEGADECARAFVFDTANATSCGAIVDGDCVLSAAAGSFISLPWGGIVAAKRTPVGPRFAFSAPPEIVQGQIRVFVEPTDPCFSVPDSLVTADGGLTFTALGADGVYSASGPFSRPFVLTEPLYCYGNGWSSREVCTDRLDVYLPPFASRISATTTLVPSLVAVEMLLLATWVAVRIFS